MDDYERLLFTVGKCKIASGERVNRSGTNKFVHHEDPLGLGITLEAATYLRPMHGSSRSRLIQASDGKLYVMKMTPNPLGKNVLANEAIGFHLMRGLGFHVPPCRTIMVTARFLARFPDLQGDTNDASELSSGLHFASQCFHDVRLHSANGWPRANPTLVDNHSDFLGVCLFDIWASHQDKREWLPQRIAQTGAYRAAFIDNSHLFGGPDWERTSGRQRGFSSNFIHSISPKDWEVRRWIALFRETIPVLFRRAIEMTPSQWFQGDIRELELCFLDRLAQLEFLVQRERDFEWAFRHATLSTRELFRSARPQCLFDFPSDDRGV